MTGSAPPRELTTVGDWLRYAATRLGRAELYFGHGTDNAWDEAVALVLGWLRLPEDRADALLGSRVTAAEAAELAGALRQRIEDRVPVPYLTGRAWLMGFEFEVDRRVLVPRSPIAGMLADGLQPWLGDRLPRRILDLCCGCGCLGIIAARLFPEAELVLADLSEEALQVAAANVRRHDLVERTRLRRGDGFAALEPGDAGADGFDLVMCNPPYVDATDLASMPPEYRHEPVLGLAGGGDGLDLVDRLLREAPDHLAADGLLVLEVGNAAPALLERFPALPLTWPELEHGGTGVALIEATDLAAGTETD